MPHPMWMCARRFPCRRRLVCAVPRSRPSTSIQTLPSPSTPHLPAICHPTMAVRTSATIRSWVSVLRSIQWMDRLSTTRAWSVFYNRPLKRKRFPISFASREVEAQIQAPSRSPWPGFRPFLFQYRIAIHTLPSAFRASTIGRTLLTCSTPPWNASLLTWL